MRATRQTGNLGVDNVLWPSSLPLQCQNKEGSEVVCAAAMAKRKLKKSKETSSVVGGKRTNTKEMTQPEKNMFPLAALALFVAVCVVPLTAEISTCEYPGL